MARHHDDQKESPVYAAGAFGAAALTLGVLIWLTASHKIVWGSLAPGLALGAMWKWLGVEYGVRQWNFLVESVQTFAYQPNAVSFVTWVGFINVALRPIMVILMLGYIALMVWLARRKRSYTRKFTPHELMMMTAQKFTGILPVIKLRKQISQDKHPLWRTQVRPEEIFLNYRVPKKDGVPQLAAAGAPMVRGKEFDRHVARNYFVGLRGTFPDGRLDSIMLGRQVVNLPTDVDKGGNYCFSDRMSPEGKTLVALWAAVAFGGEKGRAEFCKYRDLLNRSAYGTRDGMANLSLAQPLYEQYRNNAMLKKLFAVHHWEHTLLFQLLALAQRKGRFTTAEVLWLRPTNRQMFFSLNSRGSNTPHTEAAATFAMHAFERLCGKLGRLPLYQDGDVLRHMIYVDKAVDGLELAWQRWEDAIDEDDETWWTDKNLWESSNAAVNAAFAQAAKAVPPRGTPGAEPTDHDRMWADGDTDIDTTPPVSRAGAKSAAGGSTAFYEPL